MKKLINDPASVVSEMLEGFVSLNPALVLLGDELVVTRSDLDSWKNRHHVAVISGGGAGHEPAHAGYVGEGMLTAAVSGEVFTSPSVDAIFNAIMACGTRAGVLLIIKNYTGDRLNFGVAAELARAAGVAVQMVIVGDDAATRTDDREFAGRGVAGVVLIHKIAGAAAAAGLSLEQVRAEALNAASRLCTMGVALGSCTVPAAGRPTFTLEDTEIEFGLGIHGERGIRRATLTDANAITDELVSTVSKQLSLSAQDSVVMLVNNLGSTPLMELGIVARRACQKLTSCGVVIERGWCGTFLTALEMSGCSISIMKTTPTILSWLDVQTSASAWTAVPSRRPINDGGAVRRKMSFPPQKSSVIQGQPSVHTKSYEVIYSAIADSLIAAEDRLTQLDQFAGDGDLGLSMSRAARTLRDNCSDLSAQSPSDGLRVLATLLRRSMAGTSGPLYVAALLRASGMLQGLEPSLEDWCNAIDAGSAAIAELGGAQAGDRTMLDALYPAAKALRQAASGRCSWVEAVANAAKAAEIAAEATSQMFPRRGRSAYLGDRVMGSPDPGAVAVGVWLNAVRRGSETLP